MHAVRYMYIFKKEVIFMKFTLHYIPMLKQKLYSKNNNSIDVKPHIYMSKNLHANLYNIDSGLRS